MFLQKKNTILGKKLAIFYTYLSIKSVKMSALLDEVIDEKKLVKNQEKSG